MSTYHERIRDVKEALLKARSRINLSFDAWSSPNHLSLLGIVAYWIDEKYELKTTLLALRPVEGHHGYQAAEVIAPVIKSFRIENNVGAFQMDNASNNDIAMSALAASLPSAGIDPQESRLRCFGHIVNLVVKALLYGNSSLQKELDDCSN
jgi:hypothetical protein